MVIFTAICASLGGKLNWYVILITFPQKGLPRDILVHFLLLHVAANLNCRIRWYVCKNGFFWTQKWQRNFYMNIHALESKMKQIFLLLLLCFHYNFVFKTPYAAKALVLPNKSCAALIPLQDGAVPPCATSVSHPRWSRSTTTFWLSELEANATRSSQLKSSSFCHFNYVDKRRLKLFNRHVVMTASLGNGN